MVDTIRTQTDLLANLFQDGQAPASITAQDMRDFVISAYSPARVVTVEEKGDLPAPAGGVIALVANTQYKIINSIDLGTDVLTAGGATFISGAGEDIITLQTTNAAALITSAEDLTIRDIALVNDGGPCLAQSGAGKHTHLRDVMFTSAAADTFAGGELLSAEDCEWLSGAAGCVVSGAWTDAIYFRGCEWRLLTGTPTLLALSAGTVLPIFEIIGCEFNEAAGQTGLDIEVNIVPTVGGQIVDSFFTGAGDALAPAGIDETTIGWIFRNNVGVASSAIIGNIVFEDNVLETIINTINVYEDIATSVAYSLGPNAQRFQLHADTVSLQYIGIQTTHMAITVAIVLDGAANNKVYEVEVLLNGSVQLDTFTAHYKSLQIDRVHVTFSTALVTNDYITIRIRNTTDSVNVTVEDLQISMTRAG